jgi:hypothetical protein
MPRGWPLGGLTPERHEVISVTEQQVFETCYRSTQLPLWDARTDDFSTMIRLRTYAPHRRSPVFNGPLSLTLPDQGRVASS